MRGHSLALATLLLLHGCTCASSGSSADDDDSHQPRQQGCDVTPQSAENLACSFAGGGACVDGSSCGEGLVPDPSHVCFNGAGTCCIYPREPGANVDATVGPGEAGAEASGDDAAPGDEATTDAAADAGDGAVEDAEDAGETPDVATVTPCGHVECAAGCICIDPVSGLCECS